MKHKLWLVFWTLALTALFYLTSHADAGDYAFKYGMGLNDQKPTGSIKLFSLREESYEVGPIYSAKEVGLWVDRISSDRNGACFGKYQMGVKPGARNRGIYAKAFWGVELQSSTDSQLGGIIQFSQDAGLGIKDQDSFLEAGYTHISSAGIWSPNIGRDFITLSLGVSF